MGSSINKLTDLECKKANPKGVSEISKNDGGGLYLRVRSTGGKTWYFRYSIFDGYDKDGKKQYKKTKATIGDYPLITIKEARVQRDILSKQHKSGVDPKVYLDKQKNKNITESRQYKKYKFSYVKDELIKFNTTQTSDPWSKEYVQRLHGFWKNYITPSGYADYNITEIDEEKVVDILLYVNKNPFDTRRKTNQVGKKKNNLNTMGKVRSFLGLIFNHARHIMQLKGADGKKLENPVKQTEGSPLLKGMHRHTARKSIDVEFIGQYWDAINNLNSQQDRLFLRINVVTSLRVGMQSRMKWNQFDKFKKELFFDSTQTKNKLDYTTTLPDTLVKELIAFKKLTKPKGESDYVFKNQYGEKHANEDRTNTLIKKVMKFNADAHGHRTMLKDSCELLNYNNIAIEYQLGHYKGSRDRVEGSYIKRENYNNRRREMLEAYLKFLNKKAKEYRAIVKPKQVSKKGKVATPV